jgi:hypothetical protein
LAVRRQHVYGVDQCPRAGAGRRIAQRRAGFERDGAHSGATIVQNDHEGYESDRQDCEPPHAHHVFFPFFSGPFRLVVVASFRPV